jgi:ethanolamine ammonia-lyase small subunit
MAIDRIRSLRQFTDARIALDRVGGSLATADWLALREAHAAARDAIYAELPSKKFDLEIRSQCGDLHEYLLRPDLGRRVRADDIALLPEGPFDIAIVVAGGLSPIAVEHHAGAMLKAIDLPDLSRSPVIFVRYGRVAIGDEIGERMRARLAVVLIGERPGLSAADSLGIYLTFDPRIGRTDAERNCISNIRAGGLTYAEAGRRATWLIRESLARRLSGIGLKESSQQMLTQSGDR